MAGLVRLWTGAGLCVVATNMMTSPAMQQVEAGVAKQPSSGLSLGKQSKMPLRTQLPRHLPVRGSNSLTPATDLLETDLKYG
jgi:hypothetical protein